MVVDSNGVKIELQDLVKDLITNSMYKVTDINENSRKVTIELKGGKSITTNAKYLEVWNVKK